MDYEQKKATDRNLGSPKLSARELLDRLRNLPPSDLDNPT